jgi:uncharacterized protein (UPF0335 family)
MARMPNQKRDPDLDGGDNEVAVATAQLRSFITRVEKLEEEMKTLSDDRKEVYEEAKSLGLDTPTIRTLVRWRKKDKAKREAQAALLELYSGALGEIGVFG